MLEARPANAAHMRSQPHIAWRLQSERATLEARLAMLEEQNAEQEKAYLLLSDALEACLAEVSRAYALTGVGGWLPLLPRNGGMWMPGVM